MLKLQNKEKIMKKHVKLIAFIMALGLSLGIASCGGGSTTGGTSSSVTANSSSTQSSVAEAQKVGNYTAETWEALVSLSSFENCTVAYTMNDAAGSGLTENSTHLFSADGYSRTGKRNILGGVNGTDLAYATTDTTEVANARAALIGFIAEIAFDKLSYNSTAKAYVIDGDFYTADGKTYKDVTLKVKDGKVHTVGVTVVSAEGTQTQAFTFSKYNTTTPELPEE